jgi:DNA-binding NarL/FixJ family response regulator
MIPIRVMLADDHGVVRKGLRFLLAAEPSIEVVAEAGDGRQAVRAAEENHPRVVVMDIAMPLLNGIDAATQILKKDPSIGVIMLSMYSDEEYLLRALSAGAKGYLLKDSAEDEIVRAVQTVASGKTFFSPAITHALLEDYVRRLQQTGERDSYGLLTDRERELLQLLAEGKTNKEAATTMGLAPSTVETHRANLMQKLGLRNTAEIVLYAVRKRIIQ